ncbi:alanyl-tRNA synthetase [Thecamonas trahens ATCC 50062]|uniref:Alanyl-tRNA synthetase n=1 Tax=Thecamonas trahens ATCC 50062 TaxID=461836 RepID=A0A0L0DHD9_THETB|nr:alanyl-tRNA synthetase [Thecamonas trahens ATCC 50062]KNC51727.1 alanyl-tRNA synthetase [Thecamonas trahens ATCC 50062]|eukprot:XP_013755856.1 alanyl-tRNA synthetase [Thecamonas trahens ATCC 50062]
MTTKLYLDDTDLVKCEAVATAEVILDATVVYPQGGGQPSDKATISSVDGSVVFRVDKAVLDRDSDVVVHTGAYMPGSEPLVPGMPVVVAVDAELRALHARLHSAGHLLDAAMRNLGYADLEPTRGAHAPHLAYVEYAGVIADPGERERLPQRLAAECAALIAAGGDVRVRHVARDDVAAECGLDEIPAYLPETMPTVRIVGMADAACPCGGTHVKNVVTIGGITIRKIKHKAGKRTVNVRYSVDPSP